MHKEEDRGEIERQRGGVTVTWANVEGQSNPRKRCFSQSIPPFACPETASRLYWGSHYLIITIAEAAP